jgi:hypothetical protein
MPSLAHTLPGAALTPRAAAARALQSGVWTEEEDALLAKWQVRARSTPAA